MIIVRLKGGLGNQMFQYAFGRFLSLKHHVPLMLDTTFLLDRTPRKNFTFRDFDLDIFNIDAAIIQNENISFFRRAWFSGRAMLAVDKMKKIFFKNPGAEQKFGFDPEKMNLGSDVYLDGYFQSEKYFVEISETIRKDFTLKDPLPEKTQKLLQEIQNNSSLCIHVRRGDFINNGFNENFGQEYYDRGIAFISKKHPIEKIYIFSDDVAWCEKNLTFNLPIMFVGDEYSGEKSRGHFALMCACKFFVIANSTFSWWAAWLGNDPEKIVVTPKGKWFKDPKINERDLIPETWTRI